MPKRSASLANAKRRPSFFPGFMKTFFTCPARRDSSTLFRPPIKQVSSSFLLPPEENPLSPRMDWSPLLLFSCGSHFRSFLSRETLLLFIVKLPCQIRKPAPHKEIKSFFLPGQIEIPQEPLKCRGLPVFLHCGTFRHC